MKRNYYLFVGQNATTGTPNKNTGLHSYYGNIMKFKTIKERSLYIYEKTGFSSQEKIVIGGKSAMRQLCLGMLKYDFNNYIDNILEFSFKNDAGYWDVNYI